MDILKNIFKKRQVFSLDKKDWLFFAGAMVIFLCTSLWTIAKSSIWFDEAFGAYLIRFNFWEIAQYTASDVHPPLYYWLLKIWSLLFGHSEFALRSMSVLFMGIAAFFGFALVRRLFTRKAAWLSLIFIIVAPMLIRYSQEMRMYALVSAIAMAATYVLVVATESKRKLPWVIYGLLVGLGMWTHYFSALVWLAHWAWRAYTLRDKGKKFVKAFFSKEWIRAHIVAVGFFLPWIPVLVYQYADVQVNGFWIPPISPMTVPNFFTNVLYYQDQDTVSPWMTAVLLVMVVALIALAIHVYRTLSSSKRTWYMLIVALAFAPIALLLIMSLPPVRPVFIDRYLVSACVGISLFIGVTIALSVKMKPIYERGLIVVVIGAMVFGITNVYTLGNYNKTLRSANDTRQIVEAVTSRSKAGEPIIADSPWLFYEAVFYDTKEHPVYFINATTEYRYGSLNMLRYNPEHKIMDLDAFTKEHPTVWYIGRPGQNKLTPPASNWKQLQEVTVSDSVSNQPSYKAVEYQIN